MNQVGSKLPPRDTDAVSPWGSKQDRSLERERKRSAILATATRLFNEGGFEKTSIDEIAHALSVTKATVYHYFASKEALLMACLREGLLAFERALVDGSSCGNDGAARLRGMLLGYGMVVASPQGKLVMNISGHELGPESRDELSSVKHRCGVLIRKAIAGGQEDGSLRAADITVVVYAVTGALNWLSEWFDPEGPVPRESMVSKMLDLFFAGLLSAEARP